MKKNNQLYTFPLRKLLFEQEEDTGLFDEEPEETDEEEPDTEKGDSDAAEEDSGEDTSEEDEDSDNSEEPDKEVIITDEPSIDGELQAVLIDFETTARKTAVAEHRSIKALYEAEEIFDLDTFTGDVARLIKNYDNLIDMEALLVNKTKEFLSDRYDDEVVSQFLDKLETQHDIEEPTVTSPVPSSNLEVPLAIGAGATGE